MIQGELLCQDELPKSIGNRVKIQGKMLNYTQLSEIIGSINKINHDTLEIKREITEKNIKVPFHNIDRIFLSAGKKSYSKRGAVIGFCTSYILGIIAIASVGDEVGIGFSTSDAIIYPLFPGLIVTVIGSMIGSRYSTEKWTEITLDQLRKRNRNIGSRIEFFRLSVPLRR